MLEKWKRSVDGGRVFGALLTDLSKAFDRLDHELLIANLNAYGFSLPALRLINDYLPNRRQRTRIGNSFRDVDIANFADDNTPFASANNTDDLIDSLEKASNSLFKWFKDNLFKGNPDRC